jgi:amino acid adenylation domain-containing protein
VTSLATAGATLVDRLDEAFRRFADRPALVVNSRTFSYAEIDQRVMALAAVLDAEMAPDDRYVGVLASRSVEAYVALLAAIRTGRAYLPLGPGFPVPRLVQMLERAGCTTVVVGDECAHLLAPLSASRSQMRFVEATAGRGNASHRPRRPSADAEVYLLFTSGTSGVPKGVPIRHRNLCAYLDDAVRHYALTPEDRCSQAFDLTFDLSAHDIFVTLTSGASLHVVPASALMSPARFISSSALTTWFSVPSVAMVLDKLRLLTPGVFPTLRWSLFCGEALPARLADRWQIAAPQATVENLYGPTETMIAVTRYTWRPNESRADCQQDIVPIGWPIGEGQTAIRRSDGRAAEAGEPGELLVGGPQVAAGYLGDPEQTASRFVRLDGAESLFYRTGDLVSFDAHGCLHFHGRLDDQVQVRGFRVELAEVDAAIRRAAGTDLALAVAVDLSAGAAPRLHAVVEGDDNESVRQRVLEECRRSLPEYMTPAGVTFMRILPVNANGKLDRKAAAAAIA